MPSSQPPKQTNQNARGPLVTTSAASCTPSRGVGSQLMQDAVNQILVNLIASSSSNAPSASSEAKKGQPVVMTTSFIRDHIDMG